VTTASDTTGDCVPAPTRWLSAAELAAACRIGTVGLRPHERQSLRAVPSLLTTSWHGDTLIVLAVDGIAWHAAAAHWTPDRLTPLTSTFPSTSTTAWLTSTTGLTPDRHGVPGVRYRGGAGLLFDCLTDTAAGRVGDWAADDPAGEVAIGPLPTIFDEAAARGAAATALPGDLATMPGRWTEALLRGARRTAPTGDWSTLRHAPVQAVRSVAGDVGRVLSAGGPRLVWAFLHLDPYVHRHGYDAVIGAALAEIQAVAARWAAAGHTVVGYADHGATGTAAPATGTWETAWAAAGSPRLCRLPVGGAGRVRWWYPRPGRAGEVRERLAAALGPHALVLASDELADLGLAAAGGLVARRVGEVVALATGDRFPLLDPADRYEHGSITETEMLIPFAVWAPPASPTSHQDAGSGEDDG
jgi:hypothetical protein